VKRPVNGAAVSPSSSGTCWAIARQAGIPPGQHRGRGQAAGQADPAPQRPACGASLDQRDQRQEQGRGEEGVAGRVEAVGLPLPSAGQQPDRGGQFHASNEHVDQEYPAPAVGYPGGLDEHPPISGPIAVDSPTTPPR
jgi:hypothetical protein